MERLETSRLLDDNRPSYQAAREAYNNVDPEMSRAIHDERALDHIEENTPSGGYLKAIVFGGLDGILTAFAIIAGAVGGGFNWEIVLILGLSNVFADALAMGAGEYLSSKAHRDYVLTEKRREQWEYKNYKEGEIKEMVLLFTQRGMSSADAELVVRKMAEYEDFFVDLMVTEELGLQLPDEDEIGLVKDGLVMFFSFAAFGLLPLLPFLLGPLNLLGDTDLAILAFACTGAALFLLGSIKSTFSTSTHWFTAGLETLVLGSTCAAVAYVVGALVGDFINTL
mmetsp:Transcript_1671/g.2646  ORF Transcript_1671/g.2646 Transcript_1671/m.2646 type:complete len:282 (-) Transcript_1671:194-1039(-)|eukprot:CAMPEP_0185031316 /NCGR_PEP_ID=MMETSP1103-20130426/18722_1 /TAXON_ID=36769 /ORGANISM="Paraphysomonas bandaiensis, Strain Caron Lab Isolate" /LENGTH=281 /DNA_ID=CAMNT_0027566807 /DNA_START=22 /DNA_END=867 /DNA_ORIENTATION=-